MDLKNKVEKFTSFLNQFDEKSVVSLLFDNTSEFVISYLGVINSGCIAHLIPTGTSQSNLNQQIIVKPNIWLNIAHGSSGTITGIFGAEHIASEICGELSPFCKNLQSVVDPSRFERRQLRRPNPLQFP